MIAIRPPLAAAVAVVTGAARGGRQRQLRVLGELFEYSTGPVSAGWRTNPSKRSLR